jgi:hypothetical protein
VILWLEWEVRLLSYSPLIFAEDSHSTTHLLLNRENRIVGALVGRPRDTGWVGVHDDALAAMKEASVKLKFDKQGKLYDRGCYHLSPHGISYGGGQKVGVVTLTVSLWGC